MAAYKCNKCGTTARLPRRLNAHTPALCSVFCDSRAAGILSNLIQYSVTSKGDEESVVELSIRRWHDKDTTEADVVLSALNLIRSMSDKEVQVYACNHNWVLQDEVCDLGCCQKVL